MRYESEGVLLAHKVQGANPELELLSPSQKSSSKLEQLLLEWLNPSGEPRHLPSREELDVLFQLADSLRVRPSFRRNLERSAAGGFESGSEIIGIDLARSFRIAQQLRSILGNFQRSNIPCLVLKGADLAFSLYEQPHLRPMRDIDLLVRPEDFSCAEACLVKLGYKNVDFRLEPAIRCDYHHRFESEEFAHAVELHWEIRSPGSRLTIPLEEVWGRSTILSQFGTTAHYLRGEILFLYLGVHVLKHKWYDCLSHFYDLALLVERDRDQLCWTSIIQDARTWAWEEQLHLLLENLEALFPGVLPDHLEVKPLPEAARQALFARVMGRAEIGAGLLYSGRWNGRDLRRVLRLDLLAPDEEGASLPRRVYRFLGHLLRKVASHARTTLRLVFLREHRSAAKAWEELERRTSSIEGRRS